MWFLLDNIFKILIWWYIRWYLKKKHWDINILDRPELTCQIYNLGYKIVITL